MYESNYDGVAKLHESYGRQLTLGIDYRNALTQALGTETNGSVRARFQTELAKVNDRIDIATEGASLCSKVLASPVKSVASPAQSVVTSQAPALEAVLV